MLSQPVITKLINFILTQYLKQKIQTKQKVTPIMKDNKYEK